MNRVLKNAVKSFIVHAMKNPSTLKRLHASLLYDHDRMSSPEEWLPDEARFVGAIMEGGAESVSQIFQDIWVLFETKRKRGGFFVEFGALDGKKISNTYLLETSYGWDGVLAEPTPVWHEQLRKNRRCNITDKCVWRASGETLAFSIAEDSGYSTITEFSSVDGHREARQGAHEILVQTITLNDLLAMFDAPRAIDFMSIDTEGSELEILQTFDFDRYKVDLLCVEHNWTANEGYLDDFLASKGFERRFAHYSLFDGWYRNRNRAS